VPPGAKRWAQRPLADGTKNRNLRALPADGTIAAVSPHWELGISRWQLENKLHYFGRSRKTVTTPPGVCTTAFHAQSLNRKVDRTGNVDANSLSVCSIAFLRCANHIISRQRPPNPFQLELADRLDSDGVLDLRQHSGADEDLSRLGLIAKARGDAPTFSNSGQKVMFEPQLPLRTANIWCGYPWQAWRGTVQQGRCSRKKTCLNSGAEGHVRAPTLRRLGEEQFSRGCCSPSKSPPKSLPRFCVPERAEFLRYNKS
jgi:hypothetical protein